MNQVQLACPVSYRLNPNIATLDVARLPALNPINSLRFELKDSLAISKAISDTTNFLSLHFQRDTSKCPPPNNTGIFPCNGYGTQHTQSTLISNLMQTPEPFVAIPTVLISTKNQILQMLKNPSMKKFLNSMKISISSMIKSVNEIPDNFYNKSELESDSSEQEIKTRIIRDSLHGIIKFEGNEQGKVFMDIIDSYIFQRLRKIRQLGFSYMVYPGATHSRFEHSLGVYHNTGILLRVLKEKLGNKFNESRAEVALFATLLHDIGHGPFSHTFEKIGKELKSIYAEHEKVSDIIIRTSEIADILNMYRAGLADEVATMIASQFPLDVYSSIVSSQFDADRLDYLQRDQLMTGFQNSYIDFDWLINNLEIKSVPVELEQGIVIEVETLVFKSKAARAIQTYLLGLFNLYPSVYFHRVTRAAEQVFKHLMLRIHKLVQRGEADKVGLSRNDPIIKFVQNPDLIDNILKLHDFGIIGALEQLVNSEDKYVSEFANMLKNRDLPKAFDVRENVQDYFEDDEFKNLTLIQRSKLVDESVSLFEKRLDNYSKEIGAEMNFWFDSGNRATYKLVSKNPGKLDTIQLSRNNKTFGIEELSEAVKIAEVYKFERVYIPFENQNVMDYLNSQLTTCCKEVFKNGLSSK